MLWPIDLNVSATVATILAVPLSVWAIFVSRRGVRRSCVRLQIGSLPHRWDAVTLVYGLRENQVLFASLPLFIKNHSKNVAAHDVTLEVVIPVGANLPYRGDNGLVSAELVKGIMPGVEFRSVVVGNFVHIYWLLPSMNPGTAAALDFPFHCPETEITRQTRAQTRDGKMVTVKYQTSIEMLFKTIVHTHDSPPSTSTFGVRGFVAGNVETLIKIGKAQSLFGRDSTQWRLRDRLFLRNRRVVFVMPAASPWSQEGVQIFARSKDKALPIYCEDYQDSRRWLFTGYAGLSRLRSTTWRIR